MSYNNSNEMAHIAVKTGVKKATLPLVNVLFLGFLGGAFIALGYLFYIRVVAGLPHEWGTLSSLIGASVFPLGLILVVVAGGELLTSTMMATSIAAFAKKITFKQLAVNWVLVTISNFMGALFVAYFFGHLLGYTETDVFLEKTIAIASAKINDTFWMAFISGIGCNWLVSLGVWASYSAEDTAGKIIGLLFPTTAFVAIGFQHVVANMFVIPAAIFAGAFTWADYFGNFVPVFLGNGFGGVVLVAGIYYMAYLRKGSKTTKLENKKVA